MAVPGPMYTAGNLVSSQMLRFCTTEMELFSEVRSRSNGIVQLSDLAEFLLEQI